MIRVYQLDELATKYDSLDRYDKSTRYVALCNNALSAFAELKRRMLR